MAVKLSPDDPRLPAGFTKHDALAIRSLTTGTANESQQKRALAWIINAAARTYDMSYRTNDRDTCFAEGKRSVGLQLVHIINLPMDVLEKKST